MLQFPIRAAFRLYCEWVSKAYTLSIMSHGDLSGGRIRQRGSGLDSDHVQNTERKKDAAPFYFLHLFSPLDTCVVIIYELPSIILGAEAAYLSNCNTRRKSDLHAMCLCSDILRTQPRKWTLKKKS